MFSNIKKDNGITLVVLVITIIILLILTGITIAQLTGKGLFEKAQLSKEETLKQAAIEKINLKITATQMKYYTESQELPSLQYFANQLCKDSDVEYVKIKDKKVSSTDDNYILPLITVGENDSILTKFKEYAYEFEINSSLQLASIDGIKVADKSDKLNSTLISKPTITLGTIENNKITVTADTGDSNKTDIAAYVFFNADTAEIIDIRKNIENLEVNNLTANTNYSVYMKILDKYGKFSEISNTLSFTTGNLGRLNITEARGGSNSSYSVVTNEVKQYLFDGIKTKQGAYGAYLMSRQENSYMTFDVEDGNMYITFCSNSYSDSGGSSGQDVNFYKLNSNNEYELYTSFTQQNDNHEYSKTYFGEGSYKVTFSSNYVEFDEWMISGN